MLTSQKEVRLVYVSFWSSDFLFTWMWLLASLRLSVLMLSLRDLKQPKLGIFVDPSLKSQGVPLNFFFYSFAHLLRQLHQLEKQHKSNLCWVFQSDIRSHLKQFRPLNSEVNLQPNDEYLCTPCVQGSTRGSEGFYAPTQSAFFYYNDVPLYCRLAF